MDRTGVLLVCSSVLPVYVIINFISAPRPFAMVEEMQHQLKLLLHRRKAYLQVAYSHVVLVPANLQSR